VNEATSACRDELAGHKWTVERASKEVFSSKHRAQYAVCLGANYKVANVRDVSGDGLAWPLTLRAPSAGRTIPKGTHHQCLGLGGCPVYPSNVSRTCRRNSAAVNGFCTNGSTRCRRMRSGCLARSICIAIGYASSRGGSCGSGSPRRIPCGRRGRPECGPDRGGARAAAPVEGRARRLGVADPGEREPHRCRHA
jgi:hypothetical protein